ncbi:MAG: hypothetical protein ACRDY7_12075 [Acidimicrobiia bacterium]
MNPIDEPDAPDPDAELVASRAEALTAEESEAGIDEPEATAEAILAESEARTEDRAATVVEERHSEDTVEPPE